VSAPGWQGRRRAEPRRDYGRAGDRPVAKGRKHWDWRYAVIAGVRSPPLHGMGKRCEEGLAGKTQG